MSKVASPEPSRADLDAALSDPDALYEVVDGAILEKPAMGIYSTLIANRLAESLRSFASAAGLGIVLTEAMFILDAGRPLRRRPDVAYVSRERWPAGREVPEEGDYDVVPDLAIEVLNPRDTDQEVARKLRKYFRYGVRQVWNVRPGTGEICLYDSPKRMTVYEGDEVLDGGNLLPGFRLRVAEVFRRTF